MARGDLFGPRRHAGDGEGSAGGKRLPGGILSGGEAVSDPFERIAVLETKVDRLVEDLKDFAQRSTDARHTQTDTFNRRTNELETKIDTILAAFEQAKGAKWLFLTSAGLFASVGGWVAAKWGVFSHLFSGTR